VVLLGDSTLDNERLGLTPSHWVDRIIFDPTLCFVSEFSGRVHKPFYVEHNIQFWGIWLF
jgi:hypothetical protein